MSNEFDVYEQELPTNMNVDFSSEDERPYWTLDEVRDQFNVVDIVEPAVDRRTTQSRRVNGGTATYEYRHVAGSSMLSIRASNGQLLATYDVLAVEVLVKMVLGSRPPSALKKFLKWAALREAGK